MVSYQNHYSLCSSQTIYTIIPSQLPLASFHLKFIKKKKAIICFLKLLAFFSAPSQAFLPIEKERLKHQLAGQ